MCKEERKTSAFAKAAILVCCFLCLQSCKNSVGFMDTLKLCVTRLCSLWKLCHSSDHLNTLSSSLLLYFNSFCGISPSVLFFSKKIIWCYHHYKSDHRRSNSVHSLACIFYSLSCMYFIWTIRWMWKREGVKFVVVSLFEVLCFVYLFKKKWLYIRNFLYLKKIISWVEVSENFNDREYIWLVWRAGVSLENLCCHILY